MGDDLDGLSVEAGDDCGRLIDAVDAVMGSTGAIVVQHRPGLRRRTQRPVLA